VTAIVPDTTTLGNDLTKLGKDCGNQDMNACDTDAHILLVAVQTAQETLSQHPAPPCLKAADTEYRASLTSLANAAKELYIGIESNDISQVQAATNNLYRASSQITKTADLIGKASCA
jgi:hypothetical protein